MLNKYKREIEQLKAENDRLKMEAISLKRAYEESFEKTGTDCKRGDWCKVCAYYGENLQFRFRKLVYIFVLWQRQMQKLY